MRALCVCVRERSVNLILPHSCMNALNGKVNISDRN